MKFCEACVHGKIHRLPHTALKDIKSYDWYTPMCVVQCKPSHFAVITFTDDYSRYCKTYFLRKKSEALENFKESKVAVEKETGLNVKALRVVNICLRNSNSF